jgi:hypothetical protein
MMMNDINIEGLDKAELLAALYNGSRPMGMGMFQARPGHMTIEHARECIGVGDDSGRMFPNAPRRELYFDYLYGRPLKIDLGGNVLRTGLYNRDNGDGAAERIVEGLRQKQAAA